MLYRGRGAGAGAAPRARRDQALVRPRVAHGAPAPPRQQRAAVRAPNPQQPPAAAPQPAPGPRSRVRPAAAAVEAAAEAGPGPGAAPEVEFLGVRDGMQTVRGVIEVDASPTLVYEILTDYDRCSEVRGGGGGAGLCARPRRGCHGNGRRARGAENRRQLRAATSV
jgi:hypothetical protein